MNIQEFKEQLIVEGLASVEKNETRPERIRGGKDGFEICRELETMKDFRHTLDQRHDHELDLQRPGTTPANTGNIAMRPCRSNMSMSGCSWSGLKLECTTVLCPRGQFSAQPRS